MARRSVLVKCTVPTYPATVVPDAVWAVTVTLTGSPALAPAEALTER